MAMALRLLRQPARRALNTAWRSSFAYSRSIGSQKILFLPPRRQATCLALVAALGLAGAAEAFAASEEAAKSDEGCLVDVPGGGPPVMPLAEAAKIAAAEERAAEEAEAQQEGPTEPTEMKSEESEEDDHYVNLEAEPEEEWPETECAMCKHMRHGPCKRMWRAWERCIDLAGARGDDVGRKCSALAQLHHRCAARHFSYYAATFDGLDALEMLLDDAQEQGLLTDAGRAAVEEEVREFRRRVEKGDFGSGGEGGEDGGGEGGEDGGDGGSDDGDGGISGSSGGDSGSGDDPGSISSPGAGSGSSGDAAAGEGKGAQPP